MNWLPKALEEIEACRGLKRDRNSHGAPTEIAIDKAKQVACVLAVMGAAKPSVGASSLGGMCFEWATLTGDAEVYVSQHGAIGMDGCLELPNEG